MDTSNSEINSLDLSLIDWKPYYRLCYSSLGQIMVSFTKVLNVTPKNNYEITLYGILKPALTDLIDSYKQLLHFESENEKNVKFHNLIVGLPYGVSVLENEHGDMFMGRAKIGQLIRASKQRIEFMLTREAPMIYKKNLELFDSFINLRNEINKFRDDMNSFEIEFIDAIDEAHNARYH